MQSQASKCYQASIYESVCSFFLPQASASVLFSIFFTCWRFTSLCSLCCLCCLCEFATFGVLSFGSSLGGDFNFLWNQKFQKHSAIAFSQQNPEVLVLFLWPFHYQFTMAIWKLQLHCPRAIFLFNLPFPFFGWLHFKKCTFFLWRLQCFISELQNSQQAWALQSRVLAFQGVLAKEVAHAITGWRDPQECLAIHLLGKSIREKPFLARPLQSILVANGGHCGCLQPNLARINFTELRQKTCPCKAQLKPRKQHIAQHIKLLPCKFKYNTKHAPHVSAKASPSQSMHDTLCHEKGHPLLMKLCQAPATTSNPWQAIQAIPNTCQHKTSHPWQANNMTIKAYCLEIQHGNSNLCSQANHDMQSMAMQTIQSKKSIKCKVLCQANDPGSMHDKSNPKNMTSSNDTTCFHAWLQKLFAFTCKNDVMTSWKNSYKPTS